MGEDSMETKQTASEFFDAGFNCAESVLAAGLKYLNIDVEALVPRLATGFGGGISRTKSVCGAYTGAVLVLGAKYGRTRLDDDRGVILSKVQELNDWFIKQFGSTNCYELTGLDFNTPEGMEKYKSGTHKDLCSGIVALTAARLEELL
jgi:C_GCAxxG_C_C family probable redox protein